MSRRSVRRGLASPGCRSRACRCIICGTTKTSDPGAIQLLVVNFDSIPPELRALEQWVAWRLVEDKKKPFDCRTGRCASVSDPSTWATFEEVRSRRERSDGMGFVLTEVDPYVGIDLDGVRDPATGEIEGWAAELVRQSGSYAEFSPSGRGIHLFVRGQAVSRRFARLEIYNKSRFLTMTGAAIDGTPPTVEDGQVLLDLLAQDDIVWDKVKRSDHKRLLDGGKAGHDSDSEADLALCSVFANHVGGDPARVERLFARSKRSQRKKWRNRADYRAQTIERACGNLFKGKTAEVEPEPAAATLTTEQLALLIELAKAVATTHGEAEDWEAMFHLIRKVARFAREHGLSVRHVPTGRGGLLRGSEQARRGEGLLGLLPREVGRGAARGGRVSPGMGGVDGEAAPEVDRRR